MSMQNTISIATKEVEEIRSESNYIKECMNNKEKENIVLKKTLDRKEVDLQSSKESLNRANSLIETHQSNSDYYEPAESRKSEVHEYRAAVYTPDYRSGRKSMVPNTSRSIISPYDSPLAGFRRSEIPIQAYYQPQPMTPRSSTIPNLQGSMTPPRAQGTAGEAVFSQSFSKLEDKSKSIDLTFRCRFLAITTKIDEPGETETRE